MPRRPASDGHDDASLGGFGAEVLLPDFCSVPTMPADYPGPCDSYAGSPSLSAYTPQSAAEPAVLSEPEYHALADEYLDRLLVRLEDMQDAREDVDVEYASGVLTLAFAASGTQPKPRTYVINKQPPNKQIWLSSPVSGPKRYDWVLDGDASGSDAPGRWICLKDGSALNDLLRDEVDVDLDAEWEET
ncbi:Mitochondrial matrix iron chaperone [Sporothrix epigloea]|uniref:ferroxidase n=1 Tax=Sporothrix epigloea TaxID=1892477 RepID=A0ABP0DFT1_9PEZI